MKLRIKLFLLTLGITLCRGVTRQSLNGQWTVTGDDETEISGLDATVPGGIFSDLMDQGVIEDIFYGTGDSNYTWVGLSDWTYKTTFTVDADLLTHQVVNLVFEGVDTFAAIQINGVDVGTTENMFVRYVFDVKEQLQVGSNEISVQFTSAVKKAAALAEDPSNEYDIPPDCPFIDYHGLCHVNRIRKMQASFSWDWGPAFASVGIWKDVYLEGYNDGVIDYVLVTPLKHPDREAWTLLITTYFGGNNISAVYGTLNATLHLGDDTKTVSVDVEQYLTEYYEILLTTSMEVPGELIKMWWPNEYGAQPLYNLTVTFTGETEQDEKTVRVAFRYIELAQDELDQGLDFYFKVNGNPLFAKGANEIPLSILPERGQDPETIRNVLQTAKDSHMNMLRVWGGGVYESDYFYDLADEYGILIWQDFMFASAIYPADDAFLKSVTAEVRHQLKRLARHPSIAIWSGNNENEAVLAVDYWGTQDNHTLYYNDYIKLYVDVIESEVKRILHEPVFITSSPTNGLETDEEGHVAQNPLDSLYGDVHFYDYSSDSWALSTFPIPRFASEYGYQSLPSLESWLTATDDIDMSSNNSLLSYRQRHPDGDEQNLNLISTQLNLPDTSSENYTKALIYFSQIVQAQAIKIETEYYRSFKGNFDEKGQGNNMGALYWQLNDVWVAPTWSGMDFTGRWKMLQYFTQYFFNPMLVTGRLSDEGSLEIYAILDGPMIPGESLIKRKILMHIYVWDSLDPLVAIEYPVALDSLKAYLVTTIDAPTAFASAGCGDTYAEAKKNCFFHLHIRDSENNDLVPFNYVFPEKLKNCNLADPNVEITSVAAADDSGKAFEIVVSTDAVAPFVWLDSHEVRGRFSENGFLHVLPTKTVVFTADEPITPDELKAALTVTHLRDKAYL